MAGIVINRGSIIAIVVAAIASTAVNALIAANAVETVSSVSEPMPVQVERYQPETNYVRQASFVGVIRAATDSALGFEVGGTIESMSAREGDYIQVGDTLATLDTDRRVAQLRAAEAELARIESDLELARLRLERITALEIDGLASKQSLDEARIAVDALDAGKAATQARLDSARIEIEKSTLVAAYDGIVAERVVQSGTVVNAGSPVVRLVAAAGYEAHVGVPVELADSLKVGKRYALKIKGKVSDVNLRAIRTDVDPTTLTVGAVFDVPSTVPANAGEPALLLLTETVAENGGWLPMSSLIEGDRGLWNVLVVTEKTGREIAVREAVEVIYSFGDRVYVRGTLASDAEVIATGLQRLSPGAEVRPIQRLEASR